MKNHKTTFVPQWYQEAPKEKTFRSIFKWGAKNQFKNPSQGFFNVIKQSLRLTDSDFNTHISLGNTVVTDSVKPVIGSDDISQLEKIVGQENIRFDSYSRLKYSSGRSMEDILSLRQGQVKDISDVVLHPRSKEEIQHIVTFCHEKKIPVHVYGGGSSVTLGLCCPKGGVTLVMNTHMNKMIKFNEINQTMTVEAGMMGPEYESLLNQAPEKLRASRRYTGGHFPQSFEYSSVGGWIVTLGSGQASSYFGDACDLVVSQEYITPAGSFKTLDYPAAATGPKVNDIMKGSEGCFGVLVAVTMKIYPYRPETSNAFSFMFPEFNLAVKTAKQISQAGFGMPSVLRLSDPEETDVAMKMYGLEGGLLDKFLRFKHLDPGSRCLLMGQTDGEKSFSRNVFKQVKKVARSNKGLYLTGLPASKWRKGRFSDPYMRDALNDFGVLIDTLEASVTWDHIDDLYHGVRQYIKRHPHTICMTHASHFYAQGTNLYFIFITKMHSIDKFRTFQRGIIEKIEKNHGSLSHHHGVGRMMAPWIEKHLGKEQMDVLRAIKSHFDPNNIMNPGGLGL